MSWKRLLGSMALSVFIMAADMVSLMAVNRLYRPHHPPSWVTGAFYHFLAWPLLITQHIFSRAPGDTFGGPTFLAVAAGGLIDFVLFTLIMYALLSWRAHRKARV